MEKLLKYRQTFLTINSRQYVTYERDMLESLSWSLLLVGFQIKHPLGRGH